MTVQLVAYNEPLQPDFRGAAFRRQTARAKAKVDGLLKDADRFQVLPAKGVWVHCLPPSRVPARRYRGPRGWQLKLYVCVRSRHYWPTVFRLSRALSGTSCVWKFFFGKRRDYARPDKIVFYADSVFVLKRLVRAIRAHLGERSFHGMFHAGPAEALGLESGAQKGLFVGCDPVFLGDVSWRRYRSLCVAWASINEEYLASLPGGAARWYERMNISRQHEGPARLDPDPADLSYIRRYWRIANQVA